MMIVKRSVYQRMPDEYICSLWKALGLCQENDVWRKCTAKGVTPVVIVISWIYTS